MIFSQRNLRIGGIALLLAVIIALLIFPRETEDVFQRCQDLYARGQYNACFKALTKELRKNPDWHECRELLVKAQLDGNDPLAALPNFLYLLEAGKEVDLKTSLLRRLSESDEEIQKKARLLLEERLAAQPELYKIRELLLQFELPWRTCPLRTMHRDG